MTGQSAASLAVLAEKQAGLRCVIADISFAGLWTVCTCGVTVTGDGIDQMGWNYQAHRAGRKQARRAAAKRLRGADTAPTRADGAYPGVDAPDALEEAV